MKHEYKSGTDLFENRYVSFRIKYGSTYYGHTITFPDINSTFFVLRQLALIKRTIVNLIKQMIVANRVKNKLNKFKV